MRPRRNVLIFHSAALGDFVLTWPLALALSRLFPQSRVIYVTQREKGLLAEAVLGVESVDAEQGWHRLYGAEPDLPEAAAKLLASTRHALTFAAVPGDVWTTSAMAAMSGAGADEAGAVEITHLPTKPAEGFAGSHADLLAEALQSQPAIQSAYRQLLASVAARGLAAGRVVGDSIVVHPGAGAPAKCWPAERYVELIRRLRAAGRRVLVALGEVEAERLGAEHVAAMERDAEVSRPQSLLELNTILRSARGFVGNDSGPTHLAGILGVPTVALFGPTDSRVWRPLGPAVEVVQEAEMEGISVDRVFEAAGKM